MKTLDEVTKALSICGRHPDCKGCPYENVSYPTEIGNTCKDIMHYDALYYMQDRSDECQEANSPLTWDELREMEGKPVWVEFEKNGNHWLIITDIKSNGAVGRGVYGENVPLYKDRIGTDWQAYRKER